MNSCCREKVPQGPSRLPLPKLGGLGGPLPYKKYKSFRERNTNHSEKLVEEIVEDKDHTERLEEADKIMKALGGKDIIVEENTDHSEKLAEEVEKLEFGKDVAELEQQLHLLK